MFIELLIVAIILLLIGSFAGLYEITKLKAYLKDEKRRVRHKNFQFSQMEAIYRDAEHALIQSMMEKEELQQQHDEFVDIAVNEELNRLSRLYYSERLDQVVEFRELVQIGEL
jgi:hypothetical protein